MKKLITLDAKNYNENAKHIIREAVRGIIVKDGKVALVKSLKMNHYKFPGGGIEDNESHKDTLIREVREETGLVVKENTIKECGCIHELRKSIYSDDVFEQFSYYYYANVEDIELNQILDDNEKKLQYVLEWANPKEAYDINAELAKDYANKFLLRETFILEMLIDIKLIKLTKDSLEEAYKVKRTSEKYVGLVQDIIDEYNEYYKDYSDLYGIYYNKRIVGLVLLTNKPLNNKWSFNDLIIDEDLQNQKLGTLATKAIINHFKEKYETDIIKIEVFKGNKKAIKCYEKCGLKITKPCEWNNDFLEMEIKL